LPWSLLGSSGSPQDGWFSTRPSVAGFARPLTAQHDEYVYEEANPSDSSRKSSLLDSLRGQLPSFSVDLTQAIRGELKRYPNMELALRLGESIDEELRPREIDEHLIKVERSVRWLAWSESGDEGREPREYILKPRRTSTSVSSVPSSLTVAGRTGSTPSTCGTCGSPNPAWHSRASRS
jgi:hypothetical protein